MATPELVDPSLWEKAANWLWAGVLFLGGIVWRSNEKKHEDRRKGEIALHQKIEEHAREDRTSFRSLEDKLDKTDDKLDKNHGEIMNFLLNSKK